MKDPEIKVSKTTHIIQLLFILFLCGLFFFYFTYLYSEITDEIKSRLLHSYNVVIFQARTILTKDFQKTEFRGFINQLKTEDQSIIGSFVIDDSGKIIVHSDYQEEGKFILKSDLEPERDKVSLSLVISPVHFIDEKTTDYNIRIPFQFRNEISGFIFLVLSEKVLDKMVFNRIFPFIYKSIIFYGIIFTTILFLLLILGMSIHNRLIRQRNFYRSQRTSYLASLAASLAHEIKNPLNSINISTQLIEDSIKDSPSCNKIEPIAERIKQEVTGLEEYLSDFLYYARPAKLDISSSVFQTIITQALHTIEPECKKNNIRIKTQLPPEHIKINADHKQLYRAILNILLNSVHAIGTNGLIEIRLSQKKNNCILEIKDNGHGIPEEIQKKIFDLFISTKTEGTGLGLAISKRIVGEHKGTILFESKEGKGTVFIISLPIRKSH